MLSGAAKAGEEDGNSLYELMTPMFVEQLSFHDLFVTIRFVALHCKELLLDGAVPWSGADCHVGRNTCQCVEYEIPLPV